MLQVLQWMFFPMKIASEILKMVKIQEYLLLKFP